MFLIALVALAGLIASVTPATATPLRDRGSAGIGDPYFPNYGNGGYDVRHYRLHIKYDPDTDRLEGIAQITLVPKVDLTRFNLDFVGLQISSLSVGGTAAGFVRRSGHELVVTPGSTLDAGHPVVVRVAYAGIPVTFHIPGEQIRTGVVRTDDGALIWGEPEVATAWFPSNDHPRDKASFEIDLEVPAGLEAVSNGVLLGHATDGGWTTWRWRERIPMAPYLAMAAIGQFDLRFARTPGGLPIVDAIDPNVTTNPERALGKEARVIAFLRRQFGPYPFDALGGVVDNITMNTALENQTRPTYDPAFFRGGRGMQVVVHELAHQWFGDSVSVDVWQHIWLNEGFATYAQWLWTGAHGGGSPARIAADFCRDFPADDSFWDIEPGDPGVGHLFAGAVYFRGALTLQALRRTVGSDDFFRILRRWAATRGGSTGTTAQFVALAESISGHQLDGLFHTWLFTSSKPAHCAG
jgi:aminopeptidase N